MKAKCQITNAYGKQTRVYVESDDVGNLLSVVTAGDAVPILDKLNDQQKKTCQRAIVRAFWAVAKETRAR